MATARLDLIDGHRGRKTFDGWEVERIAIVSGVTGTGHLRIFNAADHADMPDIGDAHPSRSVCYLREMVLDAVTSEEIRFRLIYSDVTRPGFQPQLDTVEVGGTLSQIETNLDRFGDVIEVSYTYPSDYPDDSYSSKTFTTGGLVSKFVPEHTIVVSRIETANPSRAAIDYVGTVNSGPWSLDLYAGVGTWLCTGIVGRSPDAGITYTVTYTFQYRADTWTTTVAYISPDTGRPPSDLVDGTGINAYQLYPIMNFNGLGLG